MRAPAVACAAALWDRLAARMPAPEPNPSPAADFFAGVKSAWTSVFFLVLMGTYIGMIIQELYTAKTPADVGTLPMLGSSFVALLALSHAGYLVYKAAPKSSQTAVAAATTQPSMNATAPETVPIRLAIIDDVARIMALALEVDRSPADIGADGCAELALKTGVVHTIIARGTRAGAPVSGTLNLTPTADDVNKPFGLTLS